MSDSAAIRAIAVEAFRGFRDRRELSLNADAVICAGPNGTGKTSLFDALQWLLLGDIQRLKPLRMRLTDDYIVNQYRLPGPAVVEAELVLGGQTLAIRRSGTARASLLEITPAGAAVLRGSDADQYLEGALAPTPQITLKSAVLTAGLLQQDVMRSTLEAKASERFEVLNKLLGLDVLEEFEGAARQHTKTLGETLSSARDAEARIRAQRTGLANRASTLDAQTRSQASVHEATTRLEHTRAQLAGRVEIRVLDPQTEEEMTALSADLRASARALRDASAEYAAIDAERAALRAPDATDVAAAADAMDAARELVERERQEVARIEAAIGAAESSAGDFGRLVAAALPLLSDVCPICLRTIDADEIATTLQERAGEANELFSLREAVTTARRKLNDAVVAAEIAATKHAELAAYLARASAVEKRAETALATTGRVSRTDRYVIAALPATPDGLLELAGELDALASASLSLAVALHGVSSDEERRLRSEISALTDTEAARRRQVEELARRLAAAKRLQDAAVTARVAVAQNRVATLRPLVDDIFSRLDPHPAFKALDFEHDVFRARGTMTPIARDLVEERAANPALIFSSSQANVAALAFFLALGWAAGRTGLPFVILDDPLQSMDDVNVLGFSDLCRFIRADHQLMVSTHERRFARLLERKLAPRLPGQSTLIIDFKAWDRSGPYLESRYVESQVDAATARLAAA